MVSHSLSAINAQLAECVDELAGLRVLGSRVWDEPRQAGKLTAEER
jgi:hypothetical protein